MCNDFKDDKKANDFLSSFFWGENIIIKQKTAQSEI